MANTILVVDDSRELRTVLAAQLKKQGYEVHTANDGQEGLEKARQLRPDLIIMDIMMPRMDGFTAAGEMRRVDALRGTPIILLSALGGEEDIIKGIECGADDYLVKPFKAPELSAKVKMLIRKASGFSNRPEEETKQPGAPSVSDPSLRRFKETGQVISKDFAGFQIVDKLGQGGSGTVYRAIEPINLVAVALKVVSPFVSQNPGFVDRFTRSAEISIRLRHPNIMRSYTIGDYQGVHYITQELMEGPTLDVILDREGPFEEARARRLMSQVVDALAYLEREGLIHRDIKPSNIFAVKAPDGQEVAKLADFGLSRTVADMAQTMEGHVLGTPHYISPEQARGEKGLDARGDLYSLAASIYHLISGHTPFEVEGLQALIVAHIGAIPADIRSFTDRCQPRGDRAALPQVSDAFAALLARFMAKQPADRCANLSEAQALLAGLPPL